MHFFSDLHIFSLTSPFHLRLVPFFSDSSIFSPTGAFFSPFFNIIVITATPLTATAEDYELTSPVTVAANANSGTLAVTIKSNTGDIDLECFELTITSADIGSPDTCQTTTTICIKDDETTSE